MKSTKIMIVIIACLLTTWTSISLIGWMLSELSLRECYTHGGTLMLMLLFGWIPAFIVACDLHTKLNKY